MFWQNCNHFPTLKAREIARSLTNIMKITIHNFLSVPFDNLSTPLLKKFAYNPGLWTLKSHLELSSEPLHGNLICSFTGENIN